MKAEFGLLHFVVSSSRVKLVCFSLSFDSESACTVFLVCSVRVCVCFQADVVCMCFAGNKHL